MLTFEFVIALPDRVTILSGAIPYFWAEVMATIRADQAARKDALTAVSATEDFSAGHFFLHPIEQLRGDDRLVAAFHVILRNLAFIYLRFLLQKIHSESLLEQGTGVEPFLVQIHPPLTFSDYFAQLI